MTLPFLAVKHVYYLANRVINARPYLQVELRIRLRLLQVVPALPHAPQKQMTLRHLPRLWHPLMFKLLLFVLRKPRPRSRTIAMVLFLHHLQQTAEPA